MNSKLAAAILFRTVLSLTIHASTMEGGLTKMQRIYFWFGVLLPLPSIALYVLVPEGTVEHFGGTPSPTSRFWCTIAASGDAMFSVLCWAVLSHPNNLELRQSVLFGNAVYSVFHFGGFLRAHFLTEPHPRGPTLYIFGLVTAWLAYIAWGREKKIHKD